MAKSLLIILAFVLSISHSAQETLGNYITDAKTGCTVWFKHTFGEYSITWSGACKNKLVEVNAILGAFTNKTSQNILV